MINKLSYAMPVQMNNRIGFKGEREAQQIAKEFGEVELELESVGDYLNQKKIVKTPSSDLTRAADLMEKKHPHHARLLRETVQLRKGKS